MDAPRELTYRRSACAAESGRHELTRLKRMSIEDRIKAALTLRDPFAWLAPAPKEDRWMVGPEELLRAAEDVVSVLRRERIAGLVPLAQLIALKLYAGGPERST